MMAHFVCLDAHHFHTLNQSHVSSYYYFAHYNLQINNCIATIAIARYIKHNVRYICLLCDFEKA